MLVCVLKVCFSDLDFICVSVSSICKIELAAGDSSRRQSQGQVAVNITANTGNLCLTKYILMLRIPGVLSVWIL